jgi:hypothetical protein
MVNYISWASPVELSSVIGVIMWLLIVLILCAAAAAYLLLTQRKKDKAPRDTYVCDVCGEVECICHKEKHPPSK